MVTVMRRPSMSTLVTVPGSPARSRSVEAVFRAAVSAAADTTMLPSRRALVSSSWAADRAAWKAIELALRCAVVARPPSTRNAKERPAVAARSRMNSGAAKPTPWSLRQARRHCWARERRRLVMAGGTGR